MYIYIYIYIYIYEHFLHLHCFHFSVRTSGMSYQYVGDRISRDNVQNTIRKNMPGMGRNKGQFYINNKSDYVIYV